MLRAYGIQRQPGTSGIVDDVLNHFNPLQENVDEACKVIATSKLAPTDADIEDVEDHWNPTGFYTPKQVRDILMLGTQVQTAAFNVVNAGLDALQIPEHRSILMHALGDLDDNALDVNPFLRGAQQAEAAGPTGIVEATGLKRWVIYQLRAAREARWAAAVVECARPDVLFQVIQVLDSARRALVEFVKATVAVVKTALNIVAKVPDLIGSLFTFLKVFPWVVLVLGGYYVGVKTNLVPSKLDPLKLRERETFKPWRRKGA